MGPRETYCIQFIFDHYETRQLEMRKRAQKVCQSLDMLDHYKEVQSKTHLPELRLSYRGVETDVAEGILSQESIRDFIVESTAWGLFKICVEGR